MTCRFLVGDVFERMAELDDHSFDLIVTSPPFGWLRSYLPDDHPQKHLEIGSEPNPAAYLDVLLALTAEWRRLLTPHGSLAVELGDTYAGSGGAGGDYNPDGLRDGQARFDGSSSRAYGTGGHPRPSRDGVGEGWPLAKSLVGIPTLYAWSLAYGRNLLTGVESPAGRWRIRNLKPWIRSNPPVGALGDKERPATSYITVACTGSSRWFDLDAVRTAHTGPDRLGYDAREIERAKVGLSSGNGHVGQNPGGAPPLDWWHHVDAIIDHELDQRASAPDRTSERSSPKTNGEGRGGGWSTLAETGVNRQSGARGVHIRRALERAGILTTVDAYDVSPKGYAGAHYAVWPPELVRLMIDEMCPRRVCVVCGVPSRRITQPSDEYASFKGTWSSGIAEGRGAHSHKRDGQAPAALRSGGRGGLTAQNETVGWSDCGHNNWRPGAVLDPFVGSGTTLAVASGMGRDSVGIDLDESNVALAYERVGMFLEVDYAPAAETAS